MKVFSIVLTGIVLIGIALVIWFVSPSKTDLEQLLIGQWLCESGACPDEEVSFSMEGDERSYKTWLHSRPSVIDGEWLLETKTLITVCCDGLKSEWQIMQITDKELTLEAMDSSEKAILSRIVP